MDGRGGVNRAVLVAIPAILGTVTGMLLAAYTGQDAADRDGPARFTVSGLKAGGSPVMGSPEAPVTILEFGDYQCTFCHRFHQTTLNALQERYIETGRANLIFRDFALNGPDSVLAAEASHCAGDQGRYWEYHDEIYKNWAGERTGWVTRSSLSALADAVKLDHDEFESCMDQRRHLQAVLDSYMIGQEMGVDATPSFFIFNDEKIVKIRGNQPPEVFEKAIDGM